MAHNFHPTNHVPYEPGRHLESNGGGRKSAGDEVGPGDGGETLGCKMACGVRSSDAY